VFCADPRTESDFFFIHHELTGFYKCGGKCLQRGTDGFLIQGPAEIPDYLVTVVNGTVGVGNFSLSALLSKFKPFQLSWSAGL
jgi:hypothetical protein